MEDGSKEQRRQRQAYLTAVFFTGAIILFSGSLVAAYIGSKTDGFLQVWCIGISILSIVGSVAGIIIATMLIRLRHTNTDTY